MNLRTLLAFVLLGTGASLARAAAESETRALAGWTVHVNRDLLAQDSPAAERALELLRAQLDEITRIVPAAAVVELRRVPLWLTAGYPGVTPKAEYHPNPAWLREHQRDPAMARGVEFSNGRIFEAEVRRMPVFVLHELAHAYHHRVLGHDHPGIKAAFARARAGGSYDRVERQDAAGRKSLDRAYALTNSQEYFAETTEAYFGRNDFYPYTRDQLERHDPEMAVLLASLWNPGAAPRPAANPGVTYYLDATHGDDGKPGTTPAAAWRSLARANRQAFQPGDRLLLARGARFPGTLIVSVAATADSPFRVGAYGDAPIEQPPVIDAAGYEAGVHLRNCRHVIVEDLEITADAGAVQVPAARLNRAGVLVVSDRAGDYGAVEVRRLKIHDIYATEGRPDEGSGATSNQGTGIKLATPQGRLRGVRVAGCRIARTGRTGIDLLGRNEGRTFFLEDVEILDNALEDIGGPGMNPKRCRHLVVRGNTVDRSGSRLDPRMHARGSGIWPWTCEDVLIERNRFRHARGKADSCGVHIDFGCRDVIVQYNLSLDNEGGFVEILGDNFNCAYRYNLSVDDGARVKGREGATQEGKVLWTSGYAGRGQPRAGPVNCYIYNNSVYVRAGSRSCFSFGSTTRGLLIANNVFYLQGETVLVAGDQDARREGALAAIPGARVTHNLFLTAAVLPAGVPFANEAPFVGDPGFAHPGGLTAADYIPRHRTAVEDRGIEISLLPGDTAGLKGGLAVRHDILGRPIHGQPDLGAIEFDGGAPPR